MEYGIFRYIPKIYLGHTKQPTIWDIGINNFQYIFHMTDEIGISVYCVFTAYLYKNLTTKYLIITNDFILEMGSGVG